MRVKIGEVEITDYDKFDDLLGRKTEVENLTPIVLNVPTPLVIAIDAPWGSGKTTFVKLWKSYLNKKNIKYIYFNAWETDYADDPLIVLVSELDKWAVENAKEPRISDWRKNIKRTLPGIAKRSAIAAAKAATLGILELDKQQEGVAADLLGGITSDLLDNFNKQTKSISEFKYIIREVLKNLGDQNNLVIFIDELDRCRPSYAIELLERIKHLFDLERLIFILSTDTIQLSHSICAIYGNEFDAKRYLQRFIDIDYSLKKPKNIEYIKSQVKSLGIEKYFSDIGASVLCDELIDSYVFLTKRFDLKLRDINLFLTRTSLILRETSNDIFSNIYILVFLLILRDKNKELYEKYIADPKFAYQVIDFISDGLSQEEKQSNAFCLTAGYLIATHRTFDYKISFNDIKLLYHDITNTEVEDPDAKSAAFKVGEAADRRISHIPMIEKIELLHRVNV